MPGYTGTWQEIGEGWVEIGENDPLKTGDEIQIWQEWLVKNLYLRATQWAIIEKALKDHYPEFHVKSYENTEDYLIVDVIVDKNPVITAGVIVVALCLVGMGVLSVLGMRYIFKSIKAITESPAGQVAAIGIGAGGVAILVLVGLYVFGLLEVTWGRKK